jgi:hypothetical protein
LSINLKYYQFWISEVALIFALNALQAQTPLNKLLVRRLTTSDGLFTNQVYSIHQDNKGFMWFGGKGLQSYDGYRFKTHVSFDFPQLISFITDDADGNIYFGNGADLAYPTSLYQLDTVKNAYKIFQDSILIEGKKQKLLIAHTPIKAKDGTVWFALYPNAYAVLRPHATQLQVVSDDWHLQESIHYRHIFEIWNNQYIWQSNPKDGIFRIDINALTITNQWNNPKNEKIFTEKFPPLLSFSADLDSNFWMVNLVKDADVIHINSKTFVKKVFHFPTPNFNAFDYIHQVRCDKKGNVWITPSGHSGIARYNKISDTLDYMFVNAASENKLKHQYAFGAAGMNMYVDKDNNVWYPGDGVQFFNPSGQQIISYTYNNILQDIKNAPINKEKMNSGSAIDVVQMTNKDIYVSYCTAGIIRFDSNGNNPVNIDLPITYDCIRKMFTPDGILLYFKDSYQGDVYIFNTITQKIAKLNNDYLNSSNVSKFSVENDTLVYVSDGTNGIIRYNPKSNKVHQLPQLAFPKGIEWHTRSTLPEGNNGLWISLSYGGIFLIDKSTGKKLDEFIPDIKNYYNKSDANAIAHLARWNADTILLCTFNGLIIYNTKTKIAKKVTITNGLIDNHLAYCIVDTINKNVWLNGTYKGLCKINLYTGRVIAPVAQEGNILEAGLRIGLQTSNGDLLFFFTNGLSFIKKDKKFSNYKPNKVAITDVFINDVVIKNNIDSNSNLKLETNQNNITFHISCLDFWSNQSIIYYAYLEGLDTNYTRIDKPQLIYKGLMAGSYTLHVKSAYQNGNFCKQETVFKFKIKQVFYKSWWFILLSFSGIIYLIYFEKKK